MKFIAIMKTGFLFCIAMGLGVSSCSLITVPVKTAGSIVNTTVSTTGRVVTAPFEAVGRKNAVSVEESESPQSGTKTRVLDQKPQRRETPPDEVNQ